MRSGSNVLRGALWLRPTGPVLERLQELIRRLTMRFGGTWPIPHVTLLGGVDLSSGAEARLAAIAQRMRPVPVKLGKLAGRNERWRCFYAEVEHVPELMDGYQAACEVFEMHPAELFEPHLSLLYGHIDAPTKERLARELGGRLNLSFTAASVHLVNASVAVPVARWHTLHECALRRARERHYASRSMNA